MLTFDGAEALEILAGLFRPDVLHELHRSLRKLALPALLLSGDADPFCPPDQLHRWAASIPSARGQVFPDIHHDLINYVAHAEVSAAITGAVAPWAIDPGNPS